MNELNQIIKKWKQNITRIPEIGIDDWASYTEETLKGNDVFISCPDDIVDLIIRYEINTVQAAKILTVLWVNGKADVNKIANPKNAISLGYSYKARIAMRKSLAKKEIDGQTYTYRRYIGKPNMPDDSHQTDVAHFKHATENKQTPPYADVSTSQGVKYVIAHLRGPIVGNIKERLEHLKIAGEDYKGEAKRLKKAIDGIVKELS